MTARTTRDLSDRHEDFIARLTGGRRTPGSGNGFANQADVRNSHADGSWPYLYAADGKSTRSKSVSVTMAMWEKLVEQSHDLTPLLPLRFYKDDTLRNTLDLVVVAADHFGELLRAAREHESCPPEES